MNANQKKLSKAKILRIKDSSDSTIKSIPRACRNAIKIIANAIEIPPKKTNNSVGTAIF
jgi:lambda repressor-like predicted transcriptional regulator